MWHLPSCLGAATMRTEAERGRGGELAEKVHERFFFSPFAAFFHQTKMSCPPPPLSPKKKKKKREREREKNPS